MRKIANVKNDASPYVRIILHAPKKGGVFIFTCRTLEDGSSDGDFHFSSLEDAEACCEEEYGITVSDWQLIDDPLPLCQQDWIAPVRVKGRDTGKPEWGAFEKLVDGEWVEFEPHKKKRKSPP